MCIFTFIMQTKADAIQEILGFFGLSVFKVISSVSSNLMLDQTFVNHPQPLTYSLSLFNM